MLMGFFSRGPVAVRTTWLLSQSLFYRAPDRDGCCSQSNRLSELSITPEDPPTESAFHNKGQQGKFLIDGFMTSERRRGICFWPQ